MGAAAGTESSWDPKHKTLEALEGHIQALAALLEGKADRVVVLADMSVCLTSRVRQTGSSIYARG